MKYIFVCNLAFLIILLINLGYGQVSQPKPTQSPTEQNSNSNLLTPTPTVAPTPDDFENWDWATPVQEEPKIRVCGTIRFEDKSLLSDVQIIFEYKLNDDFFEKTIEADVYQSGDYCLKRVPVKILSDSASGDFEFVIYSRSLSSPFITKGTLKSLPSFFALSSGDEGVLNITVPLEKRFQTPTPKPTTAPTKTPKPTAAPTPIKITTPLPTQTPVTNNSNSNGNIAPTPTALPPSKIDEILAKMNLGNIAFVAPETMTVAKSETVYLRLSIAQTIAELKQEIEREGLKGKVDTVKGIKIDNQMQAVLTGGDDFKVTPITPDTLPISNQTTTEWRWDVKATRGGNLKLYLTLNAIVEYEDGAGKRPVTIKTFNKEYIVAVPWSENAVFKFAGNNWQWLWTTLIVPVGLWFWNRKRKKTRLIGIAAYQEEKKTKAGFVKKESEKKNSKDES